MGDLNDQISRLSALCAEVDAEDGPSFSAVLSRIAARMWCRLGHSADFVVMTAHHARLEHRFHGTPPSVPHPTALAWRDGMGIDLTEDPPRGEPRKHAARYPGNGKRVDARAWLAERRGDA